MKIIYLALIGSVFALSSNVSAALVGRLADSNGVFHAYYDDVANLTWLADANYALTSGYAAADKFGRMNWELSNAWAENLSVGGVDGWRLVDTIEFDASCVRPETGAYRINCSGSEMGNLYYNVLGNTYRSYSNTGPFSNIQGYYWSATEYPPFTFSAWAFDMTSGILSADGKPSNNVYAWAVKSGDVSLVFVPAVVPVPATLWLFGSGLVGLMGFARRKNREKPGQRQCQ